MVAEHHFGAHHHVVVLRQRYVLDVLLALSRPEPWQVYALCWYRVFNVYTGRAEREDLTLEVWIEMILERQARAAQNRTTRNTHVALRPVCLGSMFIGKRNGLRGLATNIICSFGAQQLDSPRQYCVPSVNSATSF